MSMEGLQGVQHAVHESQLAAETHADPQWGQALQGRSPCNSLIAFCNCAPPPTQQRAVASVTADFCASLSSSSSSFQLLPQCVVGGCNATFASQGGLARHVPTHFSSQGSSKVSHQSRVKEESPSKAGLSKRRKLKNKHRRSLRKFEHIHFVVLCES